MVYQRKYGWLKRMMGLTRSMEDKKIISITESMEDFVHKQKKNDGISKES